MAFVFRPVVIRKKNGKTIKRRSAFYWAEYVDTDGQMRREALKLPNGERITDRRAAEAALRELLTRTERKAVGLVDLAVENAGLSFRSVLARFAWHLRAKRRTPYHITKTLRRVKWLSKTGGIERLSQLNEPNISKALAVLANRRVSPKTLNDYRAAVNTVCMWAVRVAKLLDRNPVEAVPRQETNGDIRKVRRALTPDEAERLLAVSKNRSLWYEVAMFTGLRVSEQKALRWQDLELEGDRPVIHLRATATKSRRADSVPLRPSLAAKLTVTKPRFARPTDRVFKAAPKGATFRRDCRRAGIDYSPDDRGRTVDRHSLRTTFISWLSAADVHPRTAQELARHTDLRLTMKNYTDPRALDTFNAVNRLPELHPERHSQRQKATGTYDERVVVPVVVNMRGRHGNTVNAENRPEAENPVSPCDALTCASVLFTSQYQKRVSEGTRTPDPEDHNLVL